MRYLVWFIQVSLGLLICLQMSSVQGFSMLNAESPQPHEIRYTALGDSITFGLGGTELCPHDSLQSADPKTNIRCSRISIHLTAQSNSPIGSSYPDRVAHALGQTHDVTIQNLGISGAIIQDVENLELPEIQFSSNLISFYIGTNDIYRLIHGIDENNQPIANDDEAQRELRFNKFKANYLSLVKRLSSTHPSALIVLINLPKNNMWAVRLDEETIKPLADLGFVIVDLASDPLSYKSSMYSDGPHPNDKGYKHIAEQFLSAIAGKF